MPNPKPPTPPCPCPLFPQQLAVDGGISLAAVVAVEAALVGDSALGVFEVDFGSDDGAGGGLLGLAKPLAGGADDAAGVVVAGGDDEEAVVGGAGADVDIAAAPDG